MDTQFEMDTMNAVPTPRFDVGENTFAAQLLHYHAYQLLLNNSARGRAPMTNARTHITSGNKL